MLQSRNFNLYLTLDRKLTHKVMEFKQKKRLMNLKKSFLNLMGNNVFAKAFKTLSRKYSMQLCGPLFKPKFKKMNKIYSTFYIVLYFWKWNFPALTLNIFLYFLTFCETETLTKLPYILEKRNLKTLLTFQEMELLSPNWKNRKTSLKKVIIFSDISGNETFWL